MKCGSLVSVCVLLAVAAHSALGQRSSYDPAAKQQSKSREGFVDFALKQINPQNTDYGCQLDDAQQLAVDQTIKTIDSWAVMVALGFLVLSFFLLLHQHRERNRRETIAATFLAQYHNAWVDARTQASDAIRRYNELVHTTNAAGDATLRAPTTEKEGAQTRAVTADIGRSVKPQSVPLATAGTIIKPGENGSSRSEPEVDLIAQISTLQKQLNASHEREKNLQNELTKVQRRVPTVQARDVKHPG